MQQKYHGGAFVGNHVHKALKKKKPKKNHPSSSRRSSYDLSQSGAQGISYNGEVRATLPPVSGLSEAVRRNCSS